MKQDKYKIYDPTDLVNPANEYGSIFIMTNFLQTEQQQDLCEEEFDKLNSICHEDKDCSNLGSLANNWNGIHSF
jgi:hypothetical protein